MQKFYSTQYLSSSIKTPKDVAVHLQNTKGIPLVSNIYALLLFKINSCPLFLSKSSKKLRITKIMIRHVVSWTNIRRWEARVVKLTKNASMSFCLTRLAKQSHANYAYHYLCRNEWLTYLLSGLSSQCFTLLGPFSALQQSFFFLKALLLLLLTLPLLLLQLLLLLWPWQVVVHHWTVAMSWWTKMDRWVGDSTRSGGRNKP